MSTHDSEVSEALTDWAEVYWPGVVWAVEGVGHE